MDENEYAKLYADIERAIVATSAPSYLKKIKFDYYLGPSYSEDDLLKVHQIMAAEIRKQIERIFLKKIDNIENLKLQAMKDSKKRGRITKDKMKAKEVKFTSSVGGFEVETYDA